MEFVSFGSLFWGSFFILWGVSLLLQAFFGIHIPLFKTMFALFFFYLGYSILTGNSFCKPNKPATTIHCKNWNKTILFGNKTLDFSHIQMHQLPAHKEYMFLFGSGMIKINRSIPTRIIVHTTLGSAHFPDGRTITSGTTEYLTSNEPAVLEITVQVTLSSLVIQEV